MFWRVHLTNQAVQQIQILPGKPTLLAAWTQRDRATYFDLETGAVIGEHQHKAVSRQSDRWAEFLASLVAPNGAHLPVVRTAQGTFYTTADGKMRLHWLTGDDLVVELDGKEVKLELKAKAPLAAVVLDRLMGVIAALDGKGKLHLFQQHIAVGTFDLKLSTEEEAQFALAIADGGGAIFASDGREIVLVDNGGKVKKRQTVHYPIRRLACSPNGKLLVTNDAETGVIRVYSGEDLTPTHQRHASDLLESAAQLQLIADLPPPNAAPGTLAITDSGHLAFHISGVICAATLKQLDALPRPQPLL